jgi:hypothetical protein
VRPSAAGLLQTRRGTARVTDSSTVLAADRPAKIVLLASFGPLGVAQVRIRVAPSAAGSLVHMEERPVSGPSMPRACSTWSSRPATPNR